MAENQPLKNRVITTSFPEISAPLRALTDEEFENRALRLFAFQFENNRAYRRFCESRRLNPGTIAKWQDIPAVPTTAFKEFEISGLARDERTKVFHSSGTTEQRPSRHFHNAASLAIYEESLLKGFTQNVVNDSQVCVLALTPRADQAPHSSLVHMFETIARSRRREDAHGTDCNSDAPPNVGGSKFLAYVNTAGEWLLDFGKAVSCLELLCREQRRACILGTAFLFVHLLDHLRDHGLRFNLPPGSVLMETGGYKGRSRSIPRSELHGMICDTLAVTPEQIVCEYGMSELSSQAYDKVSGVKCRGSDHSRVFHFPGWCRTQVISPETGHEVVEDETGLIRVFDLANVYSVMAVQTEDLGVRRGSGFELIGRAVLSEPRGCSLMTK